MQEYYLLDVVDVIGIHIADNIPIYDVDQVAANSIRSIDPDIDGIREIGERHLLQVLSFDGYMLGKIPFQDKATCIQPGAVILRHD